MYVPFFSLTVTVFVPLNGVVVIFLFTPGPVRWKSWMFDLSLTVILYEPALSVFTLAVPFLRVMVKPGPTVPVNFVTLLVAPIGAASASAATRPAASSAIRDIVLLWAELASCLYPSHDLSGFPGLILETVG